MYIEELELRTIEDGDVVEDTYMFETGQRVTVRVTVGDCAPDAGHAVLSGRKAFGKKVPRKNSLCVVRR